MLLFRIENVAVVPCRTCYDDSTQRCSLLSNLIPSPPPPRSQSHPINTASEAAKKVEPAKPLAVEWRRDLKSKRRKKKKKKKKKNGVGEGGETCSDHGKEQGICGHGRRGRGEGAGLEEGPEESWAKASGAQEEGNSVENRTLSSMRVGIISSSKPCFLRVFGRRRVGKRQRRRVRSSNERGGIRGSWHLLTLSMVVLLLRLWLPCDNNMMPPPEI
ncbi:hypothetical protein B296_00016006 [Ensete ventricosum]|uniref:Uncharacterized protein n=1 Tax=Ensete ventricosum TaxID=4639 RepID=A0A427ARJ7_ENSVE|nr:hypothetical protein B296_00016006 [Ensete ventricosum]